MGAAKKLGSNVWVDGVLYAAGSTPPADVAKQITNPNAWSQDEDEGVVVGEDTSYADMKPAELKAEIESRNATRGDADQIPTTGNKAALVSALEADDAAQA